MITLAPATHPPNEAASSDSEEESVYKDIHMKINLKIGLEICVPIQDKMKTLSIVHFKRSTIVTQYHDGNDYIIISFGKEDLQKWSIIIISIDSVWTTLEFHLQNVWVRWNGVYQRLVTLPQDGVNSAQKTARTFSFWPIVTVPLSCPLCKGTIVKMYDTLHTDIFDENESSGKCGNYYYERVDWHRVTPKYGVNKSFIYDLKEHCKNLHPERPLWFCQTNSQAKQKENVLTLTDFIQGCLRQACEDNELQWKDLYSPQKLQNHLQIILAVAKKIAATSRQLDRYGTRSTTTQFRECAMKVITDMKQFAEWSYIKLLQKENYVPPMTRFELFNTIQLFLIDGLHWAPPFIAMNGVNLPQKELEMKK